MNGSMNLEIVGELSTSHNSSTYQNSLKLEQCSHMKEMEIDWKDV